MNLCIEKAEGESGMEVKEGGEMERGREGERKKGRKDPGSEFGYVHLNKRDTYLSNYKCHSHRKPKFKMTSRSVKPCINFNKHIFTV